MQHKHSPCNDMMTFYNYLHYLINSMMLNSIYQTLISRYLWVHDETGFYYPIFYFLSWVFLFFRAFDSVATLSPTVRSSYPRDLGAKSLFPRVSSGSSWPGRSPLSPRSRPCQRTGPPAPPFPGTSSPCWTTSPPTSTPCPSSLPPSLLWTPSQSSPRPTPMGSTRASTGRWVISVWSCPYFFLFLWWPNYLPTLHESLWFKFIPKYWPSKFSSKNK